MKNTYSVIKAESGILIVEAQQIQDSFIGRTIGSIDYPTDDFVEVLKLKTDYLNGLAENLVHGLNRDKFDETFVKEEITRLNTDTKNNTITI